MHDAPRANRPTFSTPRLRAEPVERWHAEEMVHVLRDPRVFDYLSGAPPSLAELERRYDFLSAGTSPDGSEAWLTWILVERASDAAVGFTQATVREGEHVHLAYVIGSDHQRRGFAREAVTAMLDAVFERYDVDLAILEIDVRNIASIALAESLGFRRVDTRPTTAHPGEEGVVDHVYELTREEWGAR